MRSRMSATGRTACACCSSRHAVPRIVDVALTRREVLQRLARDVCPPRRQLPPAVDPVPGVRRVDLQHEPVADPELALDDPSPSRPRGVQHPPRRPPPARRPHPRPGRLLAPAPRLPAPRLALHPSPDPSGRCRPDALAAGPVRPRAGPLALQLHARVPQRAAPGPPLVHRLGRAHPRPRAARRGPRLDHVRPPDGPRGAARRRAGARPVPAPARLLRAQGRGAGGGRAAVPDVDGPVCCAAPVGGEAGAAAAAGGAGSSAGAGAGVGRGACCGRRAGRRGGESVRAQAADGQVEQPFQEGEGRQEEAQVEGGLSARGTQCRVETGHASMLLCLTQPFDAVRSTRTLLNTRFREDVWTSLALAPHESLAAAQGSPPVRRLLRHAPVRSPPWHPVRAKTGQSGGARARGRSPLFVAGLERPSSRSFASFPPSSSFTICRDVVPNSQPQDRTRREADNPP
ncbi:hypothetical protein DMC30DRAFT_182958 [Rhodotorula diobovata]|uniref:Uncharacterized protein n=1 Tax=Rhodotorula diobovata TaxID=5288 RepID=A0A5C5G0B4_9BASI|nr:hypothetical protein DMC30DRAFT_182958 [Rhodotorula diobovata]